MFGQLRNWLSTQLKRKTRCKQLERFICFLRLSQICSEQQVQELLGTFENQRQEILSDEDGLAQFCSTLVSANAATEWQCNKLKVGKWKGFYLDDYLLLEQVGKDYEYAYYRARDIRDGSIVRLVVTPMNRTKGPRIIEYRVERSFE